MLNNPKPGWGAAAEYQVSALPFVTSSQAPTTGMEVRFPKITRFVQFQNNAAPSTYLLIAFTRNGLTSGNAFRLDGGAQITMEVRVKTLWLAGETGLTNVSLNAGLTMIDSESVPVLTGTLSDGQPGWSGVG